MRGRNSGLSFTSSSLSSRTGSDNEILAPDDHRPRTARELWVDFKDDMLVRLNLLNRDGEDKDRFLPEVSACPMVSRTSGGGEGERGDEMGDGGGQQET